MRVRCYRNLNAPKSIGTEWSVMVISDDVDPSIRGKVACYASELELENARFHVQRGGAKRVYDSQVRSVVAWVEGDLTCASFTRARLITDLPMLDSPLIPEGLARVRFDVLNGATTFTQSGAPIYEAHTVFLTQTGHCYAQGQDDAHHECRRNADHRHRQSQRVRVEADSRSEAPSGL